MKRWIDIQHKIYDHQDIIFHKLHNYEDPNIELTKDELIYILKGAIYSFMENKINKDDLAAVWKRVDRWLMCNKIKQGERFSPDEEMKKFFVPMESHEKAEHVGEVDQELKGENE